jgi:hypothetical protein
MKMREIQGHYGGKTWAGATPPCRAAARTAAALVAPAHVLPETKLSTVPVLTEYHSRPKVQPKGEQL